jgi:ABC-type multidrug transport system permease subunit
VTDAAKGDAAFYDKVFAAADQVWSSDPVQIEQTSSTTTGTSAGTGMGQSAAGIGAMFVLINGLNTAEVLLTERKRGTLQRLMVLPVSRFQILAGKLLGRYLVGLLSYFLMIGFGAVLGVRWGDWLGVLAIVLTFTLASVAMGLAFSTVVKTTQQASGLGLLGMMTLAPLGGAMWPLTIVPAWMRTVGQISPIYWSQDAFTKMVFYGGTLVDVLPSVLVLLGFVAVFLGLGVLRFRYEQ